MPEAEHDLKYDQLKELVELSAVLADPKLDIDQKLQKCVEVLAHVLQAEKVSLMLLEDESLKVVAATDKSLVGLSTSLDENTISTKALQGASPIYTKDVENSSFSLKTRDGDKSEYRTPSLICLPILDDLTPCGVLNLSDKIDAPFFNEKDFKVAKGVADQVARQLIFCAVHSRLTRAYEDLREAQQAKEDLMYMVFHDMKAPITGVKEVMKLLRPESGLHQTEKNTYLALAENDLEQLWRRITNLLDLNKMEADKYPLNITDLLLADLIGEACERLTAICRVNEVELEYTPLSQAWVRIDEDLAERIAMNLLINAIKFSSPEQGGKGLVKVVVKESQNKVMLEVFDSGPGVDSDLGEGIFERYAQGKVTKGSTGIGLYFCKNAASLLGGEVSYKNTDQGACFMLSLPVEK